MEATDVLYGVTMQEAGASTIIGMRLRDPAEQGTQEVVPIPEGGVGERPQASESDEGEAAAEEAAA
jgi:hypothetical protein